MRILIASPRLPWPIISGGNAAVFSSLKCLENDHRFTFVCPVYDEAGEENARTLQAQLPLVNIRAVFCGQTVTLPRRAAKWVVRGGRRLFQALVPSSPRELVQRRMPDYPFGPLPERVIVALQEEISKGVDLCQAEFAEMLPLGTWFPKDIPKLFVHHQIHFVYSQRFLEVHGTDSYLNYLDAQWRVHEVGHLQQFDGVVTFSEEDRKVLLSSMPSGKVFTSPFPVPADCGIAPTLPELFDGRFLFLASEENGPNRDALEWLLAGIWPEILRRSPTSQLIVIGKWSGSSVARHTVPGVSFVGFVENLSATIRGGIMLVPVRIGSGLRVKIIVAMAQGVPVVSTSVGCEGLLVTNGKELLVRDSELEFAAAAVQLAHDSGLWRRLAATGKASVSKHYSAEGVRQRRNEVYASLIQTEQRPSTILGTDGRSFLEKETPWRGCIR